MDYDHSHIVQLRIVVETLELGSCVQGCHVFKDIWSPTTEQEYRCVREVVKVLDAYVVAVISGGNAVGHVPRKISTECALF